MTNDESVHLKDDAAVAGDRPSGEPSSSADHPASEEKIGSPKGSSSALQWVIGIGISLLALALVFWNVDLTELAVGAPGVERWELAANVCLRGSLATA